MACSRETFTFTFTSTSLAERHRVSGSTEYTEWCPTFIDETSTDTVSAEKRHGTRNLKDKLLVVISSFRLAVAALTRHVLERSHDQTARRPSVISSFKLSDVKCNELPLCSCYTRTDRQTDKAVSIGIFQDMKSPKKKRETQGIKQKKKAVNKCERNRVKL